MRENEDSNTNAQVLQEAGFSAEVGKGQYFVTRLSTINSEGPTLVCRKFSLPRSDPNAQSALKDNVRIGPVLDSKTTNMAGQCSIEFSISSKQNI